MKTDDYNGMELYMGGVYNYPLLSRQEEFELGLKSVKGDEEAIDLLIRSNLRLVVKIAHSFKGLGVNLNDLVAEGNVGLITAARKFDPKRGAKFSSYSALWIKQSIRNAVAKLGRTIRIPIQSLSKISKIYKAREFWKSKYNKEPTAKQLAKHLNIAEGTISKLLKVQITCLSLNHTYTNSDIQSELIEKVRTQEDVNVVDDLYLQEDLKSMKSEFNNLRDREKIIINWRFGLDGSPPKTLEAISQRMGITRERVRQIQKTGMNRLKKFIRKSQSV